MAEEQKTRIINLAEKSAPDSGDFFAVDSQAGGSKKIPATAIAKAADLTAEASARTQADNALTSAINSASALIQNPTKTLSGALCSFTEGADMARVACTASIVPKQSGTGTPSPSNVRPISGWESVSVTDAGVNVWDEEWENGYITASGTMGNNSTSIRSKNFNSCKPNTQYHCNNPAIINICWYDSSQTFISRVDANGRNITSPSNAHYFKVSAYGYGATYNNDIAVTYPSTFTDYVPYNGHTTTTSLGQTVYGGTLDVVSGVLTVDRAMVDLGTLTWGYNQTYNLFTVEFPAQKMGNDGGITICSAYSNYTGNSIGVNDFPNNSFWNKDWGLSRNNILVKDTRYTEPTAFRTAVNGAQYCYTLATPQTYTLTGQEVSTLLGDNNVWADSGDVEITYRRDISIVLENLENAING